MPRLMEVDPKGNYVASDLLVEAPTEENGGIKTNPFTITYRHHGDQLTAAKPWRDVEVDHHGPFLVRLYSLPSGDSCRPGSPCTRG
jgi:hypothetical protein